MKRDQQRARHPYSTVCTCLRCQKAACHR
jgi:hypothetical protein